MASASQADKAVLRPVHSASRRVKHSTSIQVVAVSTAVGTVAGSAQVAGKAEEAVALFDVIETVDRPKLAGALAQAMDKEGHRPDVLIQVKTGEEEQKHGILPGEADAVIRACIEDFLLPVKGLMCIPPIDEEPSLHFALLREIARRNGLDELSMGMTADYPIAVRFGATIVRVGTAIFGARP